MKTIFKLFYLSLLVLLASCALIGNSKTVDVAINSNPQGADIVIEGRNYGKTPTVINIEPKDYVVTLTKEGHGTTNFKMETWGTIRRDIEGKRTADGTRCVLDMVSVVFSFNSWSKYCYDFKQKEYNANIPYMGSQAAISGYPEGGYKPENLSPDLVNHYYQQDMMRYGAAQKQQQVGQ
jgi:hypothetical protein